jgi:hypothetical protein
MSNLIFTAPPTLAKFMKSKAFGRIVLGPIGSGKTSACIIELLKLACTQTPAPDGFRYTRFAIVRQTLQQLKSTVLQDYETWLTANGLGGWKVSESCYHLAFDDVRSEHIFIPLEDAKDQSRLLSMQLTGAFLSEVTEVDLNVLGPISGRLGRYPSGARGNPSWFGWIADSNFPVEMGQWHSFIENAPRDVQIFKQPSGVSQEAENLNFLTQTDETKKLPIDHPVRIAQGRRYYERLVDIYGIESDWVKRYVFAQYGDDPSGAAVFKNTFKSSFHMVDDTLVIPGYPLLVAQDFGRNPWSLICQPDHLGRLLVHEEIPGINVGLELHVNQNLRPRLMQSKYLGTKIAVVGDPSGVAKGSIAEESCFDALKRMGLSAFPAPTNDIEPRIRAVEALLARQTNGGPTLLINRNGCPWLCRAMSGGYRFAKTKQGGIMKSVPDKDYGGDFMGTKVAFSHVVDDLQYACLVAHGGMMPYIRSHMMPQRVNRGPRISQMGWT